MVVNVPSVAAFERSVNARLHVRSLLLGPSHGGFTQDKRAPAVEQFAAFEDVDFVPLRLAVEAQFAGNQVAFKCP